MAAIAQATLDDLARRGASHGVDPAPGLAAVEAHLRASVAADLPFAQEASRHLIDAGGKRFRPMLVLLSGMVAGRPPTAPELVSAAVIVELIHLSTLYHDDVIDQAEVRRGTVAAHVKWSNTLAILTGDFLLARASELSASLGVDVTRLMSHTIAQLCQGEIREVQGSRGLAAQRLPRVTADRDHYLRVIAEKTASLISASTRLGAMLSGQPPQAVEALTDYGRHLGMAFQLSDDVLDIASASTESGKTPGTDLREGVLTLPVLLALEQDGPHSELAVLLDEAVDSQEDEPIEKALKLLREHAALSLARDVARLEAGRAQQALADLSRTDHNGILLDGLAELADYAVNRTG